MKYTLQMNFLPSPIRRFYNEDFHLRLKNKVVSIILDKEVSFFKNSIFKDILYLNDNTMYSSYM